MNSLSDPNNTTIHNNTAPDQASDVAQLLYDMANIIDYGYACLAKPMPKKTTNAIDVLARKILGRIGNDVRRYGEGNLALLLSEHALLPGQDLKREECLDILTKDNEALIKKLSKQDDFTPKDIDQLSKKLNDLMGLLRKHLL